LKLHPDKRDDTENLRTFTTHNLDIQITDVFLSPEIFNNRFLYSMKEANGEMAKENVL
jgi:hypothetical protein